MSRNVVKKSGMRSKSQLTGQKMSTGAAAAGQQLKNPQKPRGRRLPNPPI